MKICNGNLAAAEAARASRVDVVAAYPISPQTTIVEHIAEFIADGRMKARMVRVESEHSAMSAVAGASVVGARTFTASCSQGLQLMSEVLYFTSGMRFPVVMAVTNRTLSMPVNIWCDHQDSLVNRDSGWLQYYCTSNQEVHDRIIQAYRVCEDPRVLLPAMVCFDGFILSHAGEPVELVSPEKADNYLPPASRMRGYRPLMEPGNPLQFGEVVYPQWYPDYEYKKHRALVEAEAVAEEADREFARAFGRGYGLLDLYPAGCTDVDVLVVGLGSMMATVQHTVGKLRKEGVRAAVLTLRLFRPFPDRRVAEAVKASGARLVAVLDRDIGYGTGGMVLPDVVRALHNSGGPPCLNFIVGLGGKEVVPATIERAVRESLDALKSGNLDPAARWPDVNAGVVG